MALLSGEPRTATIQSAAQTDDIGEWLEDFDTLLVKDHQLATAVERLSHERAIKNLSSGAGNPTEWAKVASSNLEHLSRSEAQKMLVEAGNGAGMAIVLGNILDTIPGCLVIGAKFAGLANSVDHPDNGDVHWWNPGSSGQRFDAQAGRLSPVYDFRAVVGRYSVAGIAAAAAGKIFVGSGSHVAIFSQAVAGGAVLAVVAHAMIPESIHEGGSLVGHPTVAGFLFALWLALAQSFV